VGFPVKDALLPVPAGWSPQTTLAAYSPAAADLRVAVQSELRATEARLDGEEARGRDTCWPRHALRELRWRLEYTADATAIQGALERLRRLAEPGLPTCPDGPDVWFLKLDAAIDHILAAEFDDRGHPPVFLDRVNDPLRLREYLESLLVSRPAEDGIDRRKELNFATADLVRLILWRRPRGYPWDPRLEHVIRQFVAEWQDPISGFFGATYLVGRQRIRTVDLSLTFHMARYLDGRIGYWPQLIDTLLRIRDDRYPNGWLDGAGMTSHNNYDVAVLFQLGWPHMRRDQRLSGARELGRLLDWCLATGIAANGEVVARACGETLPESYYFTVAFLDTVGYFDPAKRFWTNRAFPEAPTLQKALKDHLSAFAKSDPMTLMAYDRLRGRRPTAEPPA
jgi:hypothetical protein